MVVAEGGMALGIVHEEAIYNCMHGSEHLRRGVVKTWGNLDLNKGTIIIAISGTRVITFPVVG